MLNILYAKCGKCRPKCTNKKFEQRNTELTVFSSFLMLSAHRVMSGLVFNKSINQARAKEFTQSGTVKFLRMIALALYFCTITFSFWSASFNHKKY